MDVKRLWTAHVISLPRVPKHIQHCHKRQNSSLLTLTTHHFCNNAAITFLLSYKYLAYGIQKNAPLESVVHLYS